MEDGGGVVRVKKDEVSGRLVMIAHMYVGDISFAGRLHRRRPGSSPSPTGSPPA